ncbi:MAG: ribosome-associated translation inhibitor RaiA [Cyanobacteria bacterium MAG APA_bin_95]|uniref:Ribosome hibernation promoting factor n=1 Tax=Candidatus Synechococcus spongiarum LMB bulk15M TaxID=1943582 RepID=A0A1T1D466_9SYNE|nr:ribosome-associated translation inhibitor RaiA [Cyanobacteria bacterium MAG APA_bin_95]OOV35634.1 ribosomal subunit interface protein [Candidatus Synechococcus spongiarum LMB bulk15M]
MKLLIHGRNLEITQAISDYTRDKLSRAVAKFEGLISEANVHLSVARNPSVQQQTAEVTVFANGAIIRAEERSENLYASIDLVSSKLSRQLRRYKERIRDHHRAEGNRSSGDNAPGAVLNGSSEAIARLDEQGQSRPALPTPAVRRKYFAMPPMTLDQAITQLELVDHDFYVFRDREDKQIRVVYRRNHGGYGVIEPRS